MVSSAVLRKKTHLEKSEIEKICSKNKYINTVFSREKNEDSYLTIKELNIITNGLLNEKILKKIIQICASKKDKLTYDDFCYFYALLNTSSFKAKIDFLLDFIFIKNDKVSKEKYINKINKYFAGSRLLNDIFLDKNLLQNSSNFIRKDIYSYIEKNHKKNLEEYSLYINNKNIIFSNKISLYNNNDNDNYIKEEGINNYENTLLLINNSKDNSNASINSVDITIVKNQQYDSLQEEFKNIEKKNNGVFPISLFEEMLKEINIDDNLVEVIGDYLKKKSKKSFMNFDLFKEVLSLLIPQTTNQIKYNKEISKGIFTLISYPKNFIVNKSLLKLFKNDYNIVKEINKLEKGKNIEINQFIDLNISKNNILIESLDHLKYLKYIFFKEKVGNDHSIEYKCLKILMKEISMQDYILKRLQYDNNFYLIDIDFWEKWSNLIVEFDKNSNYNKFRKLRINTTNFSNSQGKILEEKKFPNDYVILSETIYKLFVDWYGPPIGAEIVRHKIYLDTEFDNADESINNKKNGRKNSKKNLFTGIEKKTNKKFELELNPIFIIFYFFSEYFNNSNKSNKEMKYNLKNEYKEMKEGKKSMAFSRKTKFLDIYKKIDINIEMNNIRFWFYCNNNLSKADMNDSLEKCEIENKAIVLIEEKSNNGWLSDKKEKGKEETHDESDGNLVGLNNIGNTCFMNSILQIFLNIEQLKDIFIQENDELNKKFLSFILNSENKEINDVVNKKGYLVLEFINLLKEKWIYEKRVLTPRKFKEICGEYNPIFQTSEQQDAHDFYTFLVDKLHEETNIKSRNDNSYKNIENSDTIDTDEIDLGNECWANNIRKNASYFYALFMGQLKSTLICNECQTAKIKFEAFSSLELPIPEGNNIIIEIILFRLPYSLRKFNLEKINDDEEEDDQYSNINIKKKNSKYKKRRKEKSNINNDDNTLNAEKSNEQNEVINSLLNLNIPLRLKIEINRKEKCSSIIDKLKCMSDLNIEKYYNFTEFIMISKGKYINEDLIIDETLSNLNIVFVYELLSYKGIINLFDYEEKEKLKILSLKNQEIKYNEEKEKIKKISTISENDKNNIKRKKIIQKRQLNIPSFYFSIKEKDNNNKKIDYETYEILVPIIHRFKSKILNNLIPLINYEYFYNNKDFIILSSSDSIKPYNLYEVMWKKYMYFLNCPSNYDNKAWWKLKKRDKKKLPFIITIINKDTSACAFCPWFRFCSGCVIEPTNSDFLNVNSNSVIVVEWEKDVFVQDIDKNNFSLIMNHNSCDKISDITNNNEKIVLDDCLKLFTKSEELRDIQCEKCQKKTLFLKTLEIERLPKYLVLVLKRFKYILTNTIKIQNLINFPSQELPLQDYVSQKNINYHYNLFGVINHIGTLEGGHYYSIFNLNNKFIEFDDSQISEIRGGIETNKVYMLIYKSNNEEKRKDKNLNFVGLMDRAYKIYLQRLKFKHIFNYIFDEKYDIIYEYSNNCEFYYGEPVTVNGKNGFIVNIMKEEGAKLNNMVNVRIKLKKGFFTGKINSDKIIKETYKKQGNLAIDLLLNENKEKNEKKNDEVICGSQVCLIY